MSIAVSHATPPPARPPQPAAATSKKSGKSKSKGKSKKWRDVDLDENDVGAVQALISKELLDDT